MDSSLSGSALDMTIEDATSRLRDWVSSHVPDATVNLTQDMTSTEGINLYLWQIAPEPPQRTTRTTLFRLRLRYLLWVSARDAMQAFRWLDRLIFQAMMQTDIDVDDAALSASDWQAFGIQPQPCVALVMRIQRPQYAAQPIVTQVPAVDFRGIKVLSGQVVGPGDVPLANATIDVQSMDMSTTTDSSGRFHFRVIGGETSYTLRCRARGREMVRVVTAETAQPVMFRFEALHSLFGRVVDARSRPLAGVTVEVEAQNLTTETNIDGDFHFPSVDSLNKAQVVARHQRQTRKVEFDPRLNNGKPLLIQF